MFTQTTHISLLAKLTDGHDPVAWREFSDRYGELIRNFARGQRLQAADCDDVVQEVMMSLTKSMPGFTYDPAKGKFRSYLKTVTLHAVIKKSRQNRGEIALERMDTATSAPVEGDDGVERAWEAEWRQYHLRQAMRTIENEFNQADRLAFARYALEGRSAAETAKEVGMSLDQVYQAKSRILRRMSEIIDQQVREEG